MEGWEVDGEGGWENVISIPSSCWYDERDGKQGLLKYKHNSRFYYWFSNNLPPTKSIKYWGIYFILFFFTSLISSLHPSNPPFLNKGEYIYIFFYTFLLMFHFPSYQVYTGLMHSLSLNA